MCIGAKLLDCLDQALPITGPGTAGLDQGFPITGPGTAGIDQGFPITGPGTAGLYQLTRPQCT